MKTPISRKCGGAILTELDHGQVIGDENVSLLMESDCLDNKPFVWILNLNLCPLHSCISDGAAPESERASRQEPDVLGQTRRQATIPSHELSNHGPLNHGDPGSSEGADNTHRRLFLIPSARAATPPWNRRHARRPPKPHLNSQISDGHTPNHTRTRPPPSPAPGSCPADSSPSAPCSDSWRSTSPNPPPTSTSSSASAPSHPLVIARNHFTRIQLRVILSRSL